MFIQCLGLFGLLLGITMGIGFGMRQNDNGYEKVYDYDCLCLVDKIWYEKVYRYLKYVMEKKARGNGFHRHQIDE